MSLVNKWLDTSLGCATSPIPIINPVLNPTGDQFTFDSVNSIDNGAAITGYEWVILQGGVVQTAGSTFTLNSPDLLQSTLDVTFTGVGQFDVQLITKHAGGQTKTQYTINKAAPVALPSRGITGTNTDDFNAITIATGGSLDSAGTGNIEVDVSATYTESFYYPDRNGTLMFTISGVGGAAPAFGNFDAGINAGSQATISGSVSAGTIGATGYVWDKEIVATALKTQGYWADGQEVEIVHTVTHGGNTSDPVYTLLPIYAKIEAFSWATIGSTGSVAATRLAPGGYRNTNGLFGYTTIDPELDAHTYYIQGPSNSELNSATVPVTLENTYYRSGVMTLNIDDSFAYMGMYFDDINGLVSYTDGYYYNDVAGAAGSIGSARFQVAGGSPDVFFKLGTTPNTIRYHQSIESTSLPTSEGQTTWNSTVTKYPVNGGGINFSGTDAVGSGGGSPLTSAVAAGGTNHASWASIFSDATRNYWQGDFTESGTYYIDNRVTTTANSLAMTNISSLTIQAL